MENIWCTPFLINLLGVHLSSSSWLGYCCYRDNSELQGQFRTDVALS